MKWDLGHKYNSGHFLSAYRNPSIVYVSVPGLGGAPDEPHAVQVSLVTEGSGVGVSKEPPVNTKNVDNLNTLVSTVASNLCFEISLTECMQVRWDTLLVDGKLFVEVPNGILPDGSKERFVHILGICLDNTTYICKQF